MTHVNAVVVGSGILGLVTAKKFVDLGQKVVLLERSPVLANGATMLNHGWIHAGAVHSISTGQQRHIVVPKLLYGYDFFTRYAPEYFDRPFHPTYIAISHPELAEQAWEAWQSANVARQQLTKAHFASIEPGFNMNASTFFYATQDRRINNRLLVKKLATEIQAKGGTILTSVSYEYENQYTMNVKSPHISDRIEAPVFVYATGNDMSESFQKLTGRPLQMHFAKSHMLHMPRFSENSVVSLDRNTPIVINHGNTSLVNLSYDEFNVNNLDYSVVSEQVEKSFAVLCHFYPAAQSLAQQVRAYTCLKPNVVMETSAPNQNPTRHSVNEFNYQPIQGHVFALPGKMTEAPFVADQIVQSISHRLDLSSVAVRPLDL